MRPHISINVKDVTKSVEFYKRVFGVEPQKRTGSYAKFDLKEPALNFAMQTSSTPSRVSHLGIEVDSAEEVTAWEKRLRAAGVLKAVEKDTSCCYARQDKAWFTDPDGNAWEVFYVHEQLPVNETEEKDEGFCADATCCA